MKEEMVLVVRRELLEELGLFQGVSFDTALYLPALFSPQNNFFMPRSRAETDPTHKQIIPYALLVHEGRVLHYVRGKKAGEQRLVAKGSIGIGGHITYTDEDFFVGLGREAYLAGVRREVCEELHVRTPFTNHIVALLNDDSNEVGQVHLGIIHVLQLETPDVEKREAMITNLAFLNADELRAKHDSMETWSRLCIDALDPLLAAAATA